MFPGSEAEFTAGVFFLLESACNELAKISFHIQKRLFDGQLHGKNTAGSRSMYSGFVYSRILWGTFLVMFKQQTLYHYRFSMCMYVSCNVKIVLYFLVQCINN
jgi:hypothetical protein